VDIRPIYKTGDIIKVTVDSIGAEITQFHFLAQQFHRIATGIISILVHTPPLWIKVYPKIIPHLSQIINGFVYCLKLNFWTNTKKYGFTHLQRG